MMTLEIVAGATAKASAKRVYSLLAHSASYPRWSMIGSYRCETPPQSELNPDGEIRLFRTGLMTMREEVTAHEVNRRVDYVLHSGLPVRRYRATTTLEPLGTAKTAITWRATFEPTGRIASWFLKPFMTFVLRRLVHDLARAAEQS